MLIVAAALALAVAAGLPVAAQTPARMPAVGVLSVGPEATTAARIGRQAFEQGLNELRWIPGRTIRLDYRYADGRQERLDELARTLAGEGLDVIVARATPAIRAMKRATTTIPIVMSAAGHDPVQLGLVASLAKPGGNITGLTLLNQELPVKQLQLLKEVVPQLSRVIVLGSRAFPMPSRGQRAVDAAAKSLGVQLHRVDVATIAELDDALARLAGTAGSGLVVRSDPFVLEPNTKQVVASAVKHRLPAVYWLHTYTQAGGLMCYGADLFEVHRRSAYFVDRILRGARPMDLPIEEPSKFTLIVNLKTARALNLTMPASILARADELIQ